MRLESSLRTIGLLAVATFLLLGLAPVGALEDLSWAAPARADDHCAEVDPSTGTVTVEPNNCVGPDS